MEKRECKEKAPMVLVDSSAVRARAKFVITSKVFLPFASSSRESHYGLGTSRYVIRFCKRGKGVYAEIASPTLSSNRQKRDF